jgi:hypothetical protein
LYCADALSTPLAAEEFHGSVSARLNVASLRRSITARAGTIIERFPQVADSTLAQAELALENRLVLCGHRLQALFRGQVIPTPIVWPSRRRASWDVE